MKLSEEIAYTLDTNAIRYKTGSAIEEKHKLPTKRFFKRVINEVEDGTAVIYVPGEVRRELEVHSFVLRDKENVKIANYLEEFNLIPDAFTIAAEHFFRKMTAYVRSEFGKELNVGKGFEYPQVSDTRILISAWQYDSVLVTNNIKEFMIYPLLFGYEESKERLYDLTSEKMIQIPKKAFEKVHQDEGFLRLLKEFEDEIEKMND